MSFENGIYCENIWKSIWSYLNTGVYYGMLLGVRR